MKTFRWKRATSTTYWFLDLVSFPDEKVYLYIYQDLHNPNYYNHLPVETASWFKSMWLYPDPETLNPPASLEEVKARVEKILIDGGCKVLSEDLEVYM
jgi:hypothetical protein